MNQLEALENQILERVNEEGKQMLLQKEGELATQLEESRLSGVTKLRAAKERLDEQFTSTHDRTVQTLHNQKRDQLLREKQAIIQSIFDGALDKMKKWDESTFQDFARNALSTFASKEGIQLVLCDSSEHYFTEPFRNELSDTLANLTFSTETIPGHGFIVQSEGTTYNFTFEQMVQETKREFTAELATLAFTKQS